MLRFPITVLEFISKILSVVYSTCSLVALIVCGLIGVHVLRYIECVGLNPLRAGQCFDLDIQASASRLGDMFASILVGSAYSFFEGFLLRTASVIAPVASYVASFSAQVSSDIAPGISYVVSVPVAVVSYVASVPVAVVSFVASGSDAVVSFVASGSAAVVSFVASGSAAVVPYAALVPNEASYAAPQDSVTIYVNTCLVFVVCLVIFSASSWWNSTFVKTATGNTLHYKNGCKHSQNGTSVSIVELWKLCNGMSICQNCRRSKKKRCG